MSDARLDILIAFGLQDDAAREAVKQMDSIKESAGETSIEYAGLTDATKKYIKELQKQGDETSSLTEKKHALHAIIRALGPEYAELGHMATLFFNPATASIAALIGAFTILREKLSDAVSEVQQFQFPDPAMMKADRLDAATASWNKFAQAIQAAATAYSSAEGSANRAIQAIDRHLKQSGALLSAQKTRDLAALEAGKDNLSPEDYAAARISIEGAYSGAEQSLESGAEKQRARQRDMERANLLISGTNKKSQADKMKIGTAANDAQVEQAALQGIAELEAQIKQAESDMALAEGVESPIGAMKFLWKFGLVDPEKVSAVQQSAIQRAREGIARYRSLYGQARSHESGRAVRDQLLSEAGNELGRADVLGASNTDDTATARGGLSNTHAVEAVRVQTQAIRELAPFFSGNKDNMAAMLQLIYAGHTDIKYIKQQIQQLQSRMQSRQ